MLRIDRTAGYGAFTDAACGRIDLARVERHSEDILRIIASIHTGSVRAYQVQTVLVRIRGAVRIILANRTVGLGC
jgi:anti-anti-sigma regulatory factor